MKRHIIYIYALAALLLAGCNASRHRDMLAQLEELERQNVADSLMTNDSLAQVLTEYFNRHGTPNEQLRAHYILGRTYADLGEAPAAIEAYLDAASRADTTASDCDYKSLMAVLGQMSVIYHQQNLPQDEIKVISQYLYYLQKSGDVFAYLSYKGHLVRPYYLLGEKDKILQLVNEINHQLQLLDSQKIHALGTGAAIYIYVERGQYDKARTLIDLYEKRSGLFDAKGNIAKGWESFYWIKGFYELGIHHADSAEYYFRKAIRYGDIEAASNAYKGMLEVFYSKNNLDSLAHYSKLNEAALDSLHNRIQTESIRQASALYDYTRNKKIAEEEAKKRSEEKYMFLGVVLTILLLTGGIISFLIRKRREEEKRIQQLDRHLIIARNEQQKVNKELCQLKANNYEELIAEKQLKEQELFRRIEELEEETKHNRKVMLENHYDQFKESIIVRVFDKKTSFKKEHPLPTQKEWLLLSKEFQQDLPSVWQYFCERKKLSALEMNTCILLLLGYGEGCIVGLTDASSQTISIAKSRANMKLFGEKSATTLKINLERLLNGFA